MKMLLIFCTAVLLCAHFTGAIDIECDPAKPYIIYLATYPTGRIYSPGFLKGNDYPPSIQCQITFASPPNRYVRVKFNSLDIEISDACKTDFITLIEISDQGSQIGRGRFCGTGPVNDIISHSNQIIAVFRSDYVRAGKGFNVSYELSVSPNLCQSNELECRNRKCIKNPATQLCNGIDDCGDGTDEENCGYPVPAPPKCGDPEISPILNATWLDRIVGGIEARQGSWPWQVDLQASFIEPNGHFCGGSLLNAQWVLTAAHCVQSLRIVHMIRIHLGNHHKYERDPYEVIRYGQKLFVYGVKTSQFIKDGFFDMNHDVALIKLNAPVEISSHIQPVCLPSQNEELQHSTPCMASGWGSTRGSSGSDVLKQAQHPIQKIEKCYQPYQKVENKTMICAGRLDPLNGLCHGDSGGPLVCKKNGLWHLYGIASFITEMNFMSGICGLANKPTVFNKVSQKVDYIKSITTNN